MDNTAAINQHFRALLELIDLPSHNHVAIISDSLIRAIKLYSMTFADIEAKFRELNSRIYLLGLPMSYFGDKFKSMDVQGGHHDHALWIEVNGKDGVAHLMTDVKLDKTLIDKDLSDTGFLVLK